ncbi:hypothetical protein NP233_g6273 [Leucocoprinus birnbaumii]|uniref:E3 ubiquitin protein ligase n=1 Tax=Leucocoprinus birnbaumii TaxID=56174 RepID=A0AAD5VRA4_9AGAR|nr:hypothetical protein NP233_g6273 [Leucocoprinus birnbaumii]
MLHDSRKRPHVDDESDISSSKKRAMASGSGSPQPNGVHHNSDEPTLDNLEQFRKEAIYRRMRHYSAENDRNHLRIAELERRKNTCEAGYAAIVACWTQLIETIRLLVRPEDLPEEDIVSSQEMFDLTRCLPDKSELSSELEKRANATQRLVAKFMHLDDKINRFYQVAALQSEVATLRSRLKESEEEREHIRIQLTVAENRFERARSKTVQALEARKAKSGKSEGTEELEQKPSSPSQSVTPPPNPVVNGIHDHPYEVSALQEQVKYREAKIIELDRLVAILRDQNAALEAEVRMKEQGVHIYDNPAYKDVVQFALKMDLDLAEKYKLLAILEEDVKRLTQEKHNITDDFLRTMDKRDQDFHAALQKRDADNARLREQRDQFTAELNERRYKDAAKASALDQYRTLIESRSERIAQLEMDLNRCKAHLAAHTGNKNLLLTYLHGDDPSRQRWEILEEQLRQAQHHVTAMRQTMSSYEADVQQSMQQHIQMSQKILELTEELERYRAFLGSDPSADVGELKKLLKEKEDELEKHRLLETQRLEAEKTLYSELEKITSAWETLDQQVKSKVFDLAALEERLSRSQMEKAKSDNKYYATVRDKEALENEKKQKEKLYEKQGTAVASLSEAKRNLESQIGLLNQEYTAQKKLLESMGDHIRATEKSRTEFFAKAEMERGRSEALRHVHKEIEKSFAEVKKQELRQLEDSLIRAKKDVERQAARMKEAATTTPGSSDLENLKSILKCSTCRINFRSTVITKCMHTFCKDCVEKRIQTRQRKCPACNIAFAQSEVQQIWFQ